MSLALVDFPPSLSTASQLRPHHARLGKSWSTAVEPCLNSLLEPDPTEQPSQPAVEILFGIWINQQPIV